MTTFRSVLLAGFSALVLATAAGCSADASDGSAAASAADLSASEPNALSSATFVEGTIPVGSTTTVAYTATEYTTLKIDGVPYLAWELVEPASTGIKTQDVGATTSKKLTVSVTGQFPGNPDVLVTDGDFNILAQTKSQKTNLGDKADLQVDAHDGQKKLVLVHDMLWVAPMSFDISVAE